MKSVFLAFLLISGLLISAGAAEELVQQLELSLRRVIPDAQITEIRESPIRGIYEVALGPQIVYMTEDGRYIFSGSLMDLKESRNLSKERRAVARLAALDTLGAKSMIEFAPNNPRRMVYVFTDLDCTYCRRMHKEIGELNNAKIGVRYLAFPRAGIGSGSYNKAVSVWCNDNQKKALTDAKAGKQIKKAKCTNPVEEHYEMGRQMGIGGTPALVLDDGTEVGGYVPAKELINMLK